MRRFLKPLQLSYKDRTLRFTPEGLRFFLITLGVGVAALNTGNNLLYMVLAMMLSLIVVSGILSEQSVRKISLSRSIPQSIFAGDPFSVELKIVNPKKLVPSFSLKIEDVADRDVIVGKHYVIKIPAQQTLNVSYRGQFQTRGHHAFMSFRITTRYPFGLFIKTREIRADEEIVVYPRILPDQFHKLTTPFDSTGRFFVPKKANEGDFRSLRDYRPGDDFRRIHWRSSAKVSNLMVREFETDQTDQIILVLDRSLPERATRDRDGLFETAVSVAATMILRLDQRGLQTRLLTQGSSTPFGQGIHHVLSLFRTLSLIEPERFPEKGLWDLVDPVSPLQGSVFLISTRRGSIPGIPERYTRIPILDFHRSLCQCS